MSRGRKRFFSFALAYPSSAPQGATLGPLHFIPYVNDLPNTLSRGTECGIFADDTKIMRHILDNLDIRILQSGIENLHKWSIDWGLKFNPTKCMVLAAKRFHSIDRHDPPNYTMNSNELKQTRDIQDLGIIVDDTLTWNLHINKMVK